MKYKLHFHMVDGRVITTTFEVTIGDLEANQDAVANAIVSKPFFHFYSNGKLVIINMRNVVHVKVCEVKESLNV